MFKVSAAAPRVGIPFVTRILSRVVKVFQLGVRYKFGHMATVPREAISYRVSDGRQCVGDAI